MKLAIKVQGGWHDSRARNARLSIDSCEIIGEDKG